MVSFDDLRSFFSGRHDKVIIAADAETRVNCKKGGKIISKLPSGGVSIALDPIARASNAMYIARGKTPEDKEAGDNKGRMLIDLNGDSYVLKRIFLKDSESEGYYEGFSNQTLWPLCHVAFEKPEFSKVWFEEYKKVNKQFAEAIRQEIKGKTFIWINDYQLSLVPSLLNRPKNTTVSMFWHIPWPTWEVFRILPNKKEILESLLCCDFLSFHRGYQARNFLATVERELEARIDDETGRVYYNNNVTTVASLPMGIDADVIEELIGRDPETFIGKFKKMLDGRSEVGVEYEPYYKKGEIILGVDRLDYTKGITLRLDAIDAFFTKNPKYIGKVTYLGLLAPSREKLPSYIDLKKRVKERAQQINDKYRKKNWEPIVLKHDTLPREELLTLYKNSNLCIITARDDGMNLVSKEFVIAASTSNSPGMLVLSQFAGSAIDLTSALIVNPYDTDEVANAIKKGLEMKPDERKRRIKDMADILEERNVYDWAMKFVQAAETATRENRK